METIDIAVIVAVQDAGRAKSRLGAHLDPGQRHSLVQAMLDDLLTAVREVHTGQIVVVSPVHGYDTVAHGHDAEVLRDLGTGYLPAVMLGITHVATCGGVLVLPGDLPQARGEDVRALLHALRLAPVVLAPSIDGGTCALGLRPPDVMTPAFGADSAARHREAARTAGLALHEIRLSSLNRDVDTIDDLEAVWGQVGEATTAILEQIPIVLPGAQR
ncbi:MAG: 2-phospho-L-lactate guanylyltransferase [Dehalococcoidia bacterium]|nr:MAG: 2-phospho-L-lactate guanylyltransferase [Dehalococcoidia bacterium]